MHRINKEPQSPSDVLPARERIRAELEFITCAETLRQAPLGITSEHGAK